MSLGIVFKGPEGIVLAVDSRVTLNAEQRKGNVSIVLPATYDNATKLLKVKGQEYVGVVTFGLEALGENPRTAHSFLPEFEELLYKKYETTDENNNATVKRLSVEDFAKELSDFFMEQWQKLMSHAQNANDMVFFIGGYDENEPYGKVFEVKIPSNPIPTEQIANVFGMAWGGQRELVDRLIQGYDHNLPGVVKTYANLSNRRTEGLHTHLKQRLSLNIPYPFLPLQDCVDLSITLIRTTIAMQTWLVGVRGVGGAIDVATITRTGGFKPIQQKTVGGEDRH